LLVDDTGAWLVAHRQEMDRGEAGWWDALARFDLDQGWYGDGQLSCVEWLMLHTKMARATAFEELRVARELHRRPRTETASVKPPRPHLAASSLKWWSGRLG
jgi:hypothetical protein